MPAEIWDRTSNCSVFHRFKRGLLTTSKNEMNTCNLGLKKSGMGCDFLYFVNTEGLEGVQ